MKKVLITILMFFLTSHSFASNLTLECKSYGGTIGTGTPFKFENFPIKKVFLKIKNKFCEVDWEYENTKFPLIRESDEEFFCGFDKYDEDKNGKMLGMNIWHLTINRLNGELMAFNDRHDDKNEDYRRILEGRFSCKKANKLF